MDKSGAPYRGPRGLDGPLGPGVFLDIRTCAIIESAAHRGGIRFGTRAPAATYPSMGPCTTRNPIFPVDESGVLADRAATR